MKTILCLLFTISISKFSYAQSITFEKYYDFGATESGNCVQQTPDGGYVITGGYNNSGTTGADLLIMKTDSEGTLQWEKTYGGPYVDEGKFVQNTFDGGFIVTGVKDDITSFNSKIWLLKMDANGDTTWTKTITAGLGANHAYYVEQTTDSGYFIAGYTSARGAGNLDVFIVKTNVNGDTLWTKTYGGPDADVAYSAQQTFDGGFIIGGTTNSFGLIYGDFYLLKTDANGDSLWTKTYGGVRVDDCHSVRQTSDSGYIMVGYSGSFLDTLFNDIYLVKINSNGDTLWTKDIGGLGDDAGYSIKETTGNGYIICGATGSATINYNLYLIKTDVNGDTIWTKQYGKSNWREFGYYVCMVNDGGYAIVGQTTEFSNPDNIYFIKTDSAGVVTGINNIPVKSTSIVIYPNPFSVSATLLIPENFHLKNAEISVYDSFGREVIRSAITSSKIELQRGNFSAGVYFIQLTDNTKILYSLKFIIL